MDTVLELAAKIGLGLIIIWFFSRMTIILTWVIQPFLAGFAAGVLVTILFVVRLQRPPQV
jgi:phosphate/sulfate permease